jgi:hypothetical protein
MFDAQVRSLRRVGSRRWDDALIVRSLRRRGKSRHRGVGASGERVDVFARRLECVRHQRVDRKQIQRRLSSGGRTGQELAQQFLSRGDAEF